MSTFASSEKAAFKEFTGGKKAVIWGDENSGPYAAFTSMAPGYDAGMHFHTNDIRIVGIKGAYLYRDESGEKRVGPGDFILIKGGQKHWSGADQKEGALFYEESHGKFDMQEAK